MAEIRFKKSKRKGTVTAALIIILFYILAFLCDLFKLYGFYKQMILLCYCVFCCYYLLRFVVATFIYDIDDKALRIKKISKTRTETLRLIDIDSIIVIADKKDPVLRKYQEKGEFVTAGFFDPYYGVIVYKQNKKYKKLKISISKELMENFKEHLGEKVKI